MILYYGYGQHMKLLKVMRFEYQNVINSAKDFIKNECRKLGKDTDVHEKSIDVVYGILALLSYEKELSRYAKDFNMDGIKQVRKMDLTEVNKPMDRKKYNDVYKNVPAMDDVDPSEKAIEDVKKLKGRGAGAHLIKKSQEKSS